MKTLKLRGRLIAVVSILIFAAVAILSSVGLFSLSSAYDRSITATKEKLDQIVQSQVDCMVGVLQANYDRYTNGEQTEEEAMATAKQLVRTTRYNNGVGYFWADLSDGGNAVHINPSVEGTNRWNTKDEKGNFFVQDTIRAGDQKDGDFIDFYFAKPGESEAKAKRGFVKKFEPYGWYIGTGNYEEDMLPLVQSELDASQKARKGAILTLLLSGAAILGIGIIITAKLASDIANPIKDCAARLELLSEGDLKTEVPTAKRNDETGVLASATQKIVSSMDTMITDLSYGLEAIGNGNFAVDSRAEYAYVGNFAPLLESMKRIMEQLSATLSQINRASDQVSSGSNQVSSGAQALSQGTTQQASSVEELSATLAEISQQVKDNADNAAMASNKMKIAGNEISASNEKMQALIAAMDNISQSSQDIGKVIKTIEDIAFQTNILALNAAVEAARAGAAGKGFAVVADEVRNLASKSAQAAKSTTALIEGSINAVGKGTHLADETARALGVVVDTATEVSGFVSRITTASAEQANAIAQVTTGIDQISAVVQTNSATAEESAAASEELSSQASMLKSLAGKFKLKSGVALPEMGVQDSFNHF